MLRKKLSLLIANYFRFHLKEELNKNEALLNRITLEGIPFRELTEKMILDLETDFPDLKNLPNPGFNLFRKWNHRWKNYEERVLDYELSTYKLYNQIYYMKLLDLRDGTDDSRERFGQRVKQHLAKSTFFGQTVTFGLFFRGETLMRETIREILFSQNDFPPEEAYQVIWEQSDFMAKCNYEYFEGIVQEAYAKSDSLLKNILPDSVAEELKEKGKASPIHVDMASVLFTDFSGFTKISASMSPQELIQELDICFSAFDLIIGKYKLEKIKTIGDSYLCVGGLFGNDPDYAQNSCNAAIEILEFIKNRKQEKEQSNSLYWDIRIGIHAGPLVAGVIGEKKFAFDIWGDTVNTASRIESGGVAGKINVSESIKNILSEKFIFEPRGEIEAKGKGKVKMFFLIKKETLD